MILIFDKKTRCATKNDRIRVLDDNLMVLISESLANQDQKTSCTSRFKDKVLKKGVDVGSINLDEADELYNSLPSFTNIPAYICGFVMNNKSYPTLPYGGKAGRNIFTVTSWNGLYNKDQDLKELIEIEKVKKSGINTAKFQGIGNFAHSGYVFNTGNLLWTKQDWDLIINQL